MSDGEPWNATISPTAGAGHGQQIVVTFIDLVMGLLALVLAIGLVGAVLWQREVPLILATLLGQIVTFYFGRTVAGPPMK